MEPIKTKEYQLDKKAYFKMLLLITFQRRWWFLVFFLVIYLSQVFTLRNLAPQFTMEMLAYPITIILIYYGIFYYASWKAANRPSDPFLYAKHYKLIDNEFITDYKTNGEISKVHIDRIRKVKKMRGYYLLFISRNNAFFIPLSAFESEEDARRFNDFLQSKGLMK